MTVLFLAKKNCPYAERALAFCQMVFPDVEYHFGTWGTPFPEGAEHWRGEYVISFLSRWIVPAHVLARANVAAVNFHPAPPEYPGIGCTNWALYEGATHYGVTAHHMAPHADAGEIITVERFRVFPDDTVASLLDRTYAAMLVQFYDLVGSMAQDGPMTFIAHQPQSWSGAHRTRSELNELARITQDMPAAEIARRVRATTFGEWRPFVEIGGHRFTYTPS